MNMIDGSVRSSSIHWSNKSIQTWSYLPQPTERYFVGEQIYNLFHSFQDEAATNQLFTSVVLNEGNGHSVLQFSSSKMAAWYDVKYLIWAFETYWNLPNNDTE